MNARQALEISTEANRTTAEEQECAKTATLARLREMPEYAEALCAADAADALAAVNKAATAGLTSCSYSARREVRPPNAKAAASALGEAVGVIIALERLGYYTKLGLPYSTHDRDGDNGVNVTVWIKWSSDE